METASASTSGAGGKIATHRRKQRLPSTPYDRPPPPSKSPSWFAGVVIPSARALASGAGKILSAAVFSDSESSSSEDEDSVSDDEVDDIDEHGIHCDGDNGLDERNGTSSEMVEHGQDSPFSMQRIETKWIIEQLIRQETFSREECDRLNKVLNSRVMGSPIKIGEKISLEHVPERTFNHEDVGAFNKAAPEAKKWFEEKKVGSSAVELACGTCSLNSIALEDVENGECSPVDIGRSYMRDRPLWDSPPSRDVGLRTPLTATMKLFMDGTPYSASLNASSSSKRWSSPASGSQNIQDELKRVRSKAAEMLMDVGVSSDPALMATESRQDVDASEAPPSNPAGSVSGNNEDAEAVRIDGEHARETPTTEVAEFGEREYVNGFASVYPDATLLQNHESQDEQNNHVPTANKDKWTNLEGNCELLTETCLKIPEMDEVSSLGLQNEESSMEMTRPSSKVEEHDMSERQRGKPGRNLRRSTRKT